MSSLNFDIGSIIQLVDLGLRLSSRLVERHAGKPIGEMTDAEVRAAVAAISVRTPDDLIAEGQARVHGLTGEELGD